MGNGQTNWVLMSKEFDPPPFLIGFQENVGGVNGKS